MQTLAPILVAIAILSSSGLSCVPRLGTGIADAQAPDSGWADACRRALENWSAFFINSFCKISMRGVSHALCFDRCSPCGSNSPSALVLHVSISGDISGGTKSVTDAKKDSTRDWVENEDEM